jgi:hypothetical protein
VIVILEEKGSAEFKGSDAPRVSRGLKLITAINAKTPEIAQPARPAIVASRKYLYSFAPSSFLSAASVLCSTFRVLLYKTIDTTLDTELDKTR